jgi:hypothetical protein
MEEEDVVVHDVMMAIGIFTTPIDGSYELYVFFGGRYKRILQLIPMCQPTLKPDIAAMKAQRVEYTVNPVENVVY